MGRKLVIYQIILSKGIGMVPLIPQVTTIRQNRSNKDFS